MHAGAEILDRRLPPPVEYTTRVSGARARTPRAQDSHGLLGRADTFVCGQLQTLRKPTEKSGRALVGRRTRPQGCEISRFAADLAIPHATTSALAASRCGLSLFSVADCTIQPPGVRQTCLRGADAALVRLVPAESETSECDSRGRLCCTCTFSAHASTASRWEQRRTERTGYKNGERPSVNLLRRESLKISTLAGIRLVSPCLCLRTCPQNVECTTGRIGTSARHGLVPMLTGVMGDREYGATCELRDVSGECSFALSWVSEHLPSTPGQRCAQDADATHIPIPVRPQQTLPARRKARRPRETRFRASTHGEQSSQPGEQGRRGGTEHAPIRRPINTPCRTLGVPSSRPRLASFAPRFTLTGPGLVGLCVARRAWWPLWDIMEPTHGPPLRVYRGLRELLDSSAIELSRFLLSSPLLPLPPLPPLHSSRLSSSSLATTSSTISLL